MKSKLILLGFVFCLASQADAAFVSFVTGGARGHEFLVPGGARVAATATVPGNVVRFGYLTTANVSSSFVEFGATTINNPLSSAPIGGFVNVDTNQNTSATAIAAIKAAPQLAIWVFGQNNTQGLFTSTGWVAPGSLTTEVDSSFTITLGVSSAATTAPLVTTIPITGYLPALFVSGTPITVTGTTNPNGSHYTLGALIPEPTTSMLIGLLGAVGMMRRKR